MRRLVGGLFRHREAGFHLWHRGRCGEESEGELMCVTQRGLDFPRSDWSMNKLWCISSLLMLHFYECMHATRSSL